MIETITEMFSYTFMVHAVVAGLFLSLCSSLLGVSLVLKRYSMIGDGLTHIGFGALAVASAANLAPLGVALPVVVLAAILLLRLNGSGRLKGDSAIALISTSSLAVGVLAVSLGRGTNIDLNGYMFGTILSVSESDMYLSVALSVVVLVLFVLFYHRIFTVTFDESFAKAAGMHAGGYNMLLAVLAAVTIVLGMRLMGALLISALIVFPPLTSMRLFRSFRGVAVSSAVLSVVCFFIGICISYTSDVPAGASVVVVNLGAFLLFAAVSFALGRLFARRTGKGSFGR